MKHIERLMAKAELEYVEKFERSYLNFANGYIEGFRKARQMAAEMCERDILGGYGHGAARDILQIGEEEVQE